MKKPFILVSLWCAAWALMPLQAANNSFWDTPEDQAETSWGEPEEEVVTDWHMDEWDKYGKNNLSLSAGTVSFMGSLTKGDYTSLGCYGLSYHYQLKRWLCVGAKLNYEGIETATGTEDGKVTKHHQINMMPSLQFTYLNKRVIKLYAGVDLGMGVYWRAQDARARFAYNLTVFGLQVGARCYGLLEAGLGNESYAKVGFGVHF